MLGGSWCFRSQWCFDSGCLLHQNINARQHTLGDSELYGPAPLVQPKTFPKPRNPKLGMLPLILAVLNGDCSTPHYNPIKDC